MKRIIYCTVQVDAGVLNQVRSSHHTNLPWYDSYRHVLWIPIPIPDLQGASIRGSLLGGHVIVYVSCTVYNLQILSDAHQMGGARVHAIVHD